MPPHSPAPIARRDFIKLTGSAALATTLAAALLSLGKNALASPQPLMKILRNGTQPAARPSAENFTGTVRLDALFKADSPARISGGIVTFEPGARTNWHTHPLGQTLIVTAGLGRAQCWGGPIEEIRPGDIVWFPPEMKHWHGASPSAAMTHIAVTEQLNGKTSEWLEPVSDKHYAPTP